MTFFNPKHESWIYKLYKQKAMKTAMQELIKSINDIESKTTDQEQIYMLTALQIAALVLLEKEKEQMLNEWQRGFDDAKYIYELK